jgi:hypothetical protein
MATIEQLLGQSTKHLADMDDAQLAEYLKDITNLEPKALPVPLGTDVPDDEPVDNCPIKLRKPRKAKQPREKLNIDSLKGEFD